jgi:hypothetical protein
LKITGKAPLSVQIRAEVSILGDVSTDLQWTQLAAEPFSPELYFCLYRRDQQK